MVGPLQSPSNLTRSQERLLHINTRRKNDVIHSSSGNFIKSWYWGTKVIAGEAGILINLLHGVDHPWGDLLPLASIRADFPGSRSSQSKSITHGSSSLSFSLPSIQSGDRNVETFRDFLSWVDFEGSESSNPGWSASVNFRIVHREAETVWWLCKVTWSYSV